MTPDTYTIRELFVEAGNGHELYVHDWGNPQAKTPIVWVHPGPGSGCNDKAKTHFNPATQRVIFFDQRGCGRSLPYGSLAHNTTQDLIQDIDKIVKKLKLEDVVLTGGSWGVTLALAYAIKYPKHVKAIVLNGIFTSSKAEINWIKQGYFKTFYPDTWQELLTKTPKAYHADPVSYHAKLALTGDPETSKKAAFIYQGLEAGILQLDDRFIPSNYDEYDPSSTKIEIHYIQNDCFLPDRYIIENAHKLKMPVYLVQGRYDMVCPPTTAYDLQKQLPNAKLFWTINGHKPEHEAWNIIETILEFVTE